MTKHPNDQKIFAVIVNWNGKTDTLACLDSLHKIEKKHIDFHICVVDNGSTDDSVQVISRKYPDVKLIQTGKNLGYSGGNNLGITYALNHKADFIWLLNNDTIVDKQVLSFLSAFDDPAVGACGSKIYFAPGHEFHRDRYRESDRGRVIWYAGGVIDWDNMYASHRGVDEVDHGQYDQNQETAFITGCSFIVRAEIAQRVGNLDNRFYLYLEDLDWSLRIQKAGYTTMYIPTSVIWHLNAGSSGKPGNALHEYYFTRNRLLLGFKYAPVRTKFALAKEAVRFLFGQSSVRRKAVLDACIGRFGKQYECN